MAATAPPFPLPVPGMPIFSGPWQGMKVNSHPSDGESKHWPGKPLYRPADERAYKVKLAKAWAAQLDIAEVGVNYYLEELPVGYSLFETVQPVYRRLFGHPSGKYYDSILRFQDHFLWLMSGMDGNCKCVLCLPGKADRPIIPRTRKPREPMRTEPRRRRDLALDDPDAESTRSSSAGGLATSREKRARGMAQTYPTDEEGTRDVYKECIQNLYKNRESRKGIKDDIIEEDSFDHEAEHEALTRYFTRVEQQHSFVPRLGELVLWCNCFPDDQYLFKDPSTNEFKFFSFDTKTFSGFPDWRAGVVTAVPNSSAVDGPIDFSDILDLPSKKIDLNQSGFRVETIPDPNGKDKSASKQYRYLPMRSIRPLAHWQYVLYGFPQKKLDPSIHHALTLMTSISLVDKFEFTGAWPNGSVHCKGIYIGSELITIGDVVRTNSAGPMPVSSERAKTLNILVVSSIRLNLISIDERHTEAHASLLSDKTTITLIGFAYTSCPTTSPNSESFDAVDSETAKHVFRPVGTNQYGPWYPVHSPRHRYMVSHEQVIGRLYEPYAIRLWAGEDKIVHHAHEDPETATYGFDIAGIVAARRYATKADRRIPEDVADGPTAIGWHLADYRANGLDIALSNGLDVGAYDEIRTPKTLSRWRAFLRILRGDLSAAKDIGVSPRKVRATPYIDWARMGVLKGDEKAPGQLGKRRGRPPGSRIVDGKLVLSGSQSQGMKSAAREETATETSGVDDDVNDDGEDVKMTESSPARRIATRLNGSASLEQRDGPDSLDDTDANMDDVPLADFQQRGQFNVDNDDDDDNDDDNDEHHNPSPARLSSSDGKAPMRRTSLTKEEIMRSVETGDFADDENDDVLSDEEDWWAKPVPPARGGTEESSGGDYDPEKESQEQRQERKRKERADREQAQPATSKSIASPGSGFRPWVKDW